MIKIDKKATAKFDYDDWLEFFRKLPAPILESEELKLRSQLPSDGYAALRRWIEIFEKPSKMDKLHQGRLNAKVEKDIMELAVGDDDEEFYKALILKNVMQLETSNISQQEVARITQNINEFRKELQNIRSRKPKKGTVLEKVLEQAAMPKKTAKKPTKSTKKTTKTKKTAKKTTKKSKTTKSNTTSKKQGSKTPSKTTKTKKTVSKPSRSKNA